jgi:dihydroxyacetone kinase-like predicted kinase
MLHYSLEFVLISDAPSLEDLRESLLEYGQGLEIFPLPPDDSERTRHFKVQINTAEPTLIFDLCAQFGRIKSVKINEC